MKKFFDKFQNLNNVSLIGINGYCSKTSGEISNIRLNANISVKNVKEQDLNKLKNCTGKDILKIHSNTGISEATIELALSEMLVSATKNLSENKADRTAQSKGQTDAYINLTPAIRMHKDTLEIHIFGQVVSKVVIDKIPLETIKKAVNSSDKTLAKKAITKHLDLRAGKLRTFILGNADAINVKGDTFILI